MSLVRIVAPHFVAGAVVENGRVVRAAPIIRYMVGWSVERIDDYAQRKGWASRLTA